MASAGLLQAALAGAELDRQRFFRHPEQGADDAAAAAAKQTGQPHDLAGTQGKGGDPVRPGLQQRFAGRERNHDSGLRRASGHGGDEIVDGKGTAPAHRRHPPVAQDGAAVGDRDDFVEVMRDVDDRGALRLHAREHREQPLDLAFFQGRRRLVQDEDAALPAQRLGDRHQLPLGEAERSHRPVRVGVKVELGKHGARGVAHARAIDHGQRPEPPHRKIAERNVLGDRQRRHQPQFLRDGDDAGSDGVARARKVPRRAVDPNRAAVGTPDPAENADQRGFAGAVLADDGMNFPSGDIEVDAVKGDRRAEMLGHAFGAGGRMAHARRLMRCHSGAPRSGEPGIHNCDRRRIDVKVRSWRGLRLWIPALARFARSAGMTERAESINAARTRPASFRR